MRMSGVDLARATGGAWRGRAPALVHGLSTDTRTLRAGEAFLALRGERFDGHRFLDDAVRAGASALIVESRAVNDEGLGREDTMPPRLEVADTLMALGDVAAAWRARLAAPVVAVTGSCGKTTVRAMLAHGLRRLGWNVAETRANDNNLIGVPQTLLAVDADADVALVECGISEPGEMARLARIVRPDVAIITAIAPAHAEGLGDVRGVAREKAALLATLADDGVAVLGEGVAHVLEDAGARLAGVRCLSMDGDDASVVRWRMDGTRCRLGVDGEEDMDAVLEFGLPAWHWGADAALAATVMRRLTGCPLARVARALQGWRPVAGRMNVREGRGGAWVLDDAYNANPASMAAALDTLRRTPGRRFAVLGDMAELGRASRALHEALDVSGLDGLVLVGTEMRALAARHPEAAWTQDADGAVRRAAAWDLRRGDVVLVKGSRRMGLERVVAALEGGRRHAV